jgi:hypothetical protein
MDRAPEPFVMPLKAHSDSRGMLVAIEGARDIPFDIARVYYIIGTEGAQRGFHAHRELEQLLIAVSGSCRLTIDDGVTREDVILDRPDVGVHIDHMHWLEMRDFAPNTVLLVLASAPHRESDYIHDYDSFVAEATRGQAA